MIHQIKITLQGSKPPIWRRVLVPSNYTLAQLHEIIQISMGWDNYHLYSFEISGKQYENEEIDNSLSAEKFTITKTLKKKSKALYVYDFGDNWDHKIEVEDILKESDFNLPFCIKAVGKCPHEDSGGMWGYYQKLEILSNPKHPDYKELKDWMGDEYNKEISLEDINLDLLNIK
jgi:hypothetical protein